MGSCQSNEHEELSEMKPVVVRYKCEFCNDGEQVLVNDKPIIVPLVNRSQPMKLHRCNKCGKEMMLPKVYPFITWLSMEEYESVKDKIKS